MEFSLFSKTSGNFSKKLPLINVNAESLYWVAMPWALPTSRRAFHHP